MQHFIVVGACYLDTILSVSHYPREDEKLRAASITRRRGGNGPNTLEVMRQLITATNRGQDLRLVLCSVLPSKHSSATQQIQSSLGDTVDLSHCIYREDISEAASSYIINSVSTGTRTIVNYNQLPEMTLAEFITATKDLSGQEAWYHFEGRIPEVTLDCVKHLRQISHTTTISVEVEKPGRAGLDQLAREADVVFYSKGWAQHNGYEDPLDFLLAQSRVAVKASFLCCTWGELGAAVFDTKSNRVHKIPAFRPAGFQITDSVGAGDTFIAGMLFGLICIGNERSVEHIGQFASEMAGRKVSQDGFSGLGAIMAERYGLEKISQSRRRSSDEQTRGRDDVEE